MKKGEHLRHIIVSAQYKFVALFAPTFTVPEEIKEKTEKKRTKTKETCL